MYMNIQSQQLLKQLAINLSINQASNQSINQSINQGINVRGGLNKNDHSQVCIGSVRNLDAFVLKFL